MRSNYKPFIYNSFILSQTSKPTPWSRVLAEKLTGTQLVKKFSAFFLKLNVHQLVHVGPLTVPNLSHRNSVRVLHPTPWRSILVLHSHPRLGLQSGPFPTSLPTKTLYIALLTSIRATCRAHAILLHLIARTIFNDEDNHILIQQYNKRLYSIRK